MSSNRLQSCLIIFFAKYFAKNIREIITKKNTKNMLWRPCNPGLVAAGGALGAGMDGGEPQAAAGTGELSGKTAQVGFDRGAGAELGGGMEERNPGWEAPPGGGPIR